MSYGIKCRECGAVNALGRVFCSSCGKKLDLTRVSKRVLARSAETPMQRRMRVIRLLIVMVLLAVVALILWPIEPEGNVGEAAEAAALQTKIRRLETAVAARAHVFDVISEREVNAFLAEILAGDPSISKSEGLRLGVETLRVRFTPDELKVFLVANWGPFRLSYVVAGVPDIRERRFVLDISHGQFGHLWLPGPVAEWMGGRIAYALSGLKREQRLLDNLGRCELGDGKVRLITRSKTKSK